MQNILCTIICKVYQVQRPFKSEFNFIEFTGHLIRILLSLVPGLKTNKWNGVHLRFVIYKYEWVDKVTKRRSKMPNICRNILSIFYSKLVRSTMNINSIRFTESIKCSRHKVLTYGLFTYFTINLSTSFNSLTTVNSLAHICSSVTSCWLMLWSRSMSHASEKITHEKIAHKPNKF